MLSFQTQTILVDTFEFGTTRFCTLRDCKVVRQSSKSIKTQYILYRKQECSDLNNLTLCSHLRCRIEGERSNLYLFRSIEGQRPGNTFRIFQVLLKSLILLHKKALAEFQSKRTVLHEPPMAGSLPDRPVLTKLSPIK